MSKKILIVEDEFIVANALRLILVQAGYTVTGIAASAEEADHSLQREKADLVLLDIRLSGKSTGIDLARKLRGANIAFIYLSANSSQKVLEEAKATEPYGFLVKPFREKDLLVTLDIAWYRHKHSLETRLRQEELLQTQLQAISEGKLSAEQKLLNAAQLVQSLLPFDLIVSSSTSGGGKPSNIGYLRTGFNEYQLIGDKEISAITGLQGKDIAFAIEELNTGGDALILNNGGLKSGSFGNQPQGILFDYFKIESYMAYPIVASNGNTVNYFFYSRQRNFYGPCNVNLLNRLKAQLTNITDTLFQYERSVAWTAPKPTMPSDDAGHRSKFKNIIGDHPLLLAALDLIAQVALYNTSVLILGESGTGKESAALAIHELSPRKNEPFIKVNCAAIPATLIESELFGHEKGAFTGAFEKRKGKFELADGGTIFLDEIGELQPDMQVKLLRVLQEKEIEYVGGHQSKKVDVRIVAATNRNLEKEVAAGNFRLDLYYRLNVFPITLPPLRERKTDITALADFFGQKFCKEFGKEFLGISDTMLEEMYAYNWPGNIRELENTLERSVILNDGKCRLELKRSLNVIAPETSSKVNIGNLSDVKQVQQDTERDYIISVLKRANGRIRGENGAAELLNLKPTTLESRMAKLGIRKEDFCS
ncbi:sigma 54-interacting transcriptional regulator [Mucilaginibacter pedocola]|uniref:Fis family transcriptional regulator n=1 Tax=Mucilaginibacter pedocola TaxID=1792845 RepID=A0A1S9P747_9SPHI|nr:sigma 54-interacting transcriptional regulator [Mucilaginibacter pedocola]OOQ56782.1 Fis family transcriptional regulator [Mucilaginibacter pedocola]